MAKKQDDEKIKKMLQSISSPSAMRNSISATASGKAPGTTQTATPKATSAGPRAAKSTQTGSGKAKKLQDVANIRTGLGAIASGSAPFAAKPSALLKTAAARSNPILRMTYGQAPQTGKNEAINAIMRDSLKWHATTNPKEKAALHTANNQRRSALGLAYDDRTGRTIRLMTGENITAPVEATFGKTAGALQKRTKATAENPGLALTPEEVEHNRKQIQQAPHGLGRLAWTLDSAKESVLGGHTNYFETGRQQAVQKAEDRFLHGGDENISWLDKQALRQKYGADWLAQMQKRREATQNGDTETLRKFEELDNTSALLWGEGSAMMQDAAEQQERAKAGLGKIKSTALDITNMGAQMLANAAIAGQGSPAAFTAVSSLQQAGQGADKAKQLGKDPTEQMRYANAIGLTNALIEGMGGIGGVSAIKKPLGKLVDKVTPSALQRMGASTAGKVLSNAAEEGLENAIQYGAERRISNAMLDTNETFDPVQLAAETASGAAMGGIFGGARAIGDRIHRSASPRLEMRYGEKPGASLDGMHIDNDITTPYNDAKGVIANESGGMETPAPIFGDARRAVFGDAGRRDGSGKLGTGAETVDQSAGGIPQETERFGKVTYTYTKTPDAAVTDTARQVSFLLKEYGIETVIYNGDMQRNIDGSVSARPMVAATSPDGRVFIANDMDMQPAEVAGHEKIHHFAKANPEETADLLENALQNNLNYQNSEAMSALDKIAKAHIGRDYDLSNPKHNAKVFEEFAAYLSGWREQGADILRQYGGWFTDPEKVENGYRNMDALLRERAGQSTAKSQALGSAAEPSLEIRYGAKPGEPRPNVKPEAETRPETIIPDDYDTQLDLQAQVQDHEARLQGQSSQGIFEAGQRVKALDRGNYGTIEAAYPGSEWYDVTFYDTATGKNETVAMPGEMLEAAEGGRMLPDTTSMVKAKGQMDAPTSDSYTQNELDAHVQAAERANGQLDALESDSYRFDQSQSAIDGTEADKQVQGVQANMQRIAESHPLQRAANRASKSGADIYIEDSRVETAINISNALEDQRLALKSIARMFHFTKADLINAQEIAAGRGSLEPMSKEKTEKMDAYVRALRQYQNAMQPVYQYQHEMQTARERRVDELITASDDWKDTKFGLTLDIHTPERVFRTVAGDTPETQALIDHYITPVHEHEAQSVKWQREKRAELRKVMEGSTHEESVYMHMRNRLDLDPHNEKLQYQTEQYLRDNAKKIRTDKIDGMLQSLYQITRSMHPDISEAWVRNGYDPLEFRKNYIPSLPVTEEGNLWSRMLRKIGIETKADELPTEIAGKTDGRRPGRQYAAFANERTGLNTDFDAFLALDNYISNAASAIFHTDDIRNLRTLEERIRYKYADDGAKAEADAIRQNSSLDIEEKTQRLNDIWSRERSHLPHFPSWLTEYTNSLSGKKAHGDRNLEQKLNRQMYRTMSDLEGKVAANLTSGNISTALSNFIPLTQGGAELRKTSMASAAKEYIYDLTHGNTDFEDMSIFLTNRKGTDRAAKSKLRKAADIASMPMQIVDEFTSNVLTRARYMDNLKNGAGKAEAMQEADAWTAGVMADRSKGAMPNIFTRKNPASKAFTMFQLEVMNQYGYILKDVPRNQKEKGAAAIAGVLLQMMLGAYLFNDVREKATGTRGALDPVDIINNFIGEMAGYKLPNTVDLIIDLVSGDLDKSDFQTDKNNNWGAAVLHTAQDIASNIPFVSGPVGGLWGASNARMPVQAAVPDVVSILSKSGAARAAQAKKELAKPLTYILPPFGGGQAKKTIEGIATQRAGGSYTVDKDGKPILQFPAYGKKPWDYVQGALFGKYSSNEAREYIDSGFDRLNPVETEVYADAEKHGMDNRTAYEAIQAIAATKAPEDKSKTETQAKREAIMAFDLTPGQKAWLDLKLLGGADRDHTIDYRSEDSFKITSQITNRDKQWAAQRALDSYGVPVGTFVRLDEALRTAYQKPKTSRAQAREAVYDQILGSSLSDKQKNGLLEKLLIPELNETRQKQWAAEDWKEITQQQFFEFANTYAASVPYKWSMLETENEAKYAEKLKETGLKITDYNEIKAAASEFRADKDATGRSITGSKKRKVINYVRGRRDLTPEQQNYVIQMLGYTIGDTAAKRKKKAKQKKSTTLKKIPKLKIKFGK